MRVGILVVSAFPPLPNLVHCVQTRNENAMGSAVPVAQWIARRTSNPEAVGSSPTGDVAIFNGRT